MSNVSKLWKTLAEIIFDYVRFFETEDCRYEKEFKAAVEKLASLNEQGSKELDNRYYNYYGAHGWFSYELKVKKEAENLLIFEFGSLTDTMSVKITIGDKAYEINEAVQ